jgi:hypothetical protein
LLKKKEKVDFQKDSSGFSRDLEIISGRFGHG